MEALTLLELNGRIRQVLKSNFSDSLWVTAEITELQLNRSGHCYLQLADKREGEDVIVATARATIWASMFRMLRAYFETTTGRALAAGMKVLLRVEVVFHELYGYSLNVRDIDPTYTIGDLERKKREILARLQADGIIDMNKELEFPLLPKTIAVISSPTAAGYGDFMNQLATNPYGYRYHVRLFPAIMQGERTEESVIAALDRIYAYESLFDVVVIIRGGGSQTDLGCFDSYDLAANVAQFPLPVIAGIGHERDETIVDRVAHLRVKTPTAAATYLIEAFHRQDEMIENRKADFVAGVKELLQEESAAQIYRIATFKNQVQELLTAQHIYLKILSQRSVHASQLFVHGRRNYFVNLDAILKHHLKVISDRRRNQLDRIFQSAKQGSLDILRDHKRRLELAANTVKYTDPRNVLKRGYSITRYQGKAVRHAGQLQKGDLLETQFAYGAVASIVEVSQNLKKE